MESFERNGRTVEDALESALKELSLSRDQIEYEVLEEPSKGLFGILGGKPAKILITVKEFAAEKEKEPEKAGGDLALAARDFLQKIFTAMDLDAKIEKMTNTDNITLNLQGDDLGVLIGKHGHTLDALQYLTIWLRIVTVRNG
jgi:spoIIIJ-associated protein